MKTTIDLPDGFYQTLKNVARARKITMKQLIHHALLKLLAEEPSRGLDVFQLRDASVPGDGLTPFAESKSWDQLRELSYDTTRES